MTEEIETSEDEVIDENDDSSNVEETLEEETVDTSTDDTTESTDEVAELKAKVAELEDKNTKLYARVKAKPVAKTNTNNSSDFFEERIELIASGENKEVVSQAAVIAKAKGLTLAEAMKDPLITAYHEKIKAKEKSDRAALGASGKSIASTETQFKSGMTTEEHKAAWKKATGN